MDFDLSKVNSNNSNKAHCTIVHTPGGVGKTTFGAQACLDQGGIMLLGEDGLSPLQLKNVPRQSIKRWGTVDHIDHDNSGTSFQDVISQLVQSEHKYKLVVIDTLDSLMPSLNNYIICKHYNGDEAKANDFQKKLVDYVQEINKVLTGFYVMQEHGIEILLLVHSTIANCKEPGNEPYDRWQLNLPGNKQASVADTIYNYADNCFFANYQVVVNKRRGVGTNRVMHTQWEPAWDAKTRLELDKEIVFDYKTYSEVRKKLRQKEV